MTKSAFLARCANAYDAGLCSDERLKLLDSWVDFVMRFEGGQVSYVADFIEAEAVRTSRFASHKTLASDLDGYALVELAAILTHSCQKCAEDPKAWWTRGAFCDHKQAGIAKFPTERVE